MRKKIILILLAAMSWCGASTAWEFAGWYGGGCYPNVEFDPNVPNRVYLTSDVAGIWRSDDLGESWNFINKGLSNLNVPVIAVAPSDPNVLYAGTQKGGVCRSRDAGLHWEACEDLSGQLVFERPKSHQSIAVSPKDAAVVAAGTARGRIFYSKDHGSHWKEISQYGLDLSFLRFWKKPFLEDTPVTALRFSPDGLYLYAASKEGVARYSWEKRSWKNLMAAPRNVTDLVWRDKNTLYAAGERALSYTTDGGMTWHETSAVEKGAISRLAFSKVKDEAILAAGWLSDGKWGGITLSRDNGKTWSAEGQKLFPDEASNPTRRWTHLRTRITDLEADPFHPEVLFRTDWWGVWRSDDGGLTWHEKIKGAPNTVGSDIHVSKTGELYVATMDNGLLKSSDGGKSYSTLIPKKSYNRSINGHVWRVKTSGSRHVIATSSPWNDRVNQVMVSDDSGKNFENVRKGLPSGRPEKNTMWKEGYPRALAVDPTDENIVYLGIDGNDGGGLYVSRDKGRRWRHSSGQPGSLKIYNGLAVDPTDPKRIFWGASGKNGGVYVSSDKGASWKHVFSKMTKVYDLAVAEDGVVYCAGNEDGAVLYASYDSGASWQLLQKFPSPNTACDAIALDPRDVSRLYVGALQWGGKPDGRVYYSSDRGKSWEDLSEGLPNLPGPAAIAVDPLSDQVYVLLHHGSVYKRSCPAPKAPPL